MLSISEFKNVYFSFKNNEENIIHFQNFIDYFTSKFFETSKIFGKFDKAGVKEFCQASEYEILEEHAVAFKKGEECNSYLFILHGDLNLYDEEYNVENPPKLMKNVSAGTVYGHKIKNKFNFFGNCKNIVHLIKTPKGKFDELLSKINTRKENFKSGFLKKYFPKFRIYSDDIITSMKQYFMRQEYNKNTRLLIDGEYDEFIYIVINGTVGMIKGVRRFQNLVNYFNEKTEIMENSLVPRYLILEKFSRGDIFGAYSALKHQKNNYSVIVLSDKAEVYKISKAHCLFYFGGSSGIIPENLRGQDTVLQHSLQIKLENLEKSENFEFLKMEDFIFESNTATTQDSKYYIVNSHVTNSGKPIDETNIENNLKDAWKELENLGDELNSFKQSLLKPKASAASNVRQLDLLNKMKTENEGKYININFS